MINQPPPPEMELIEKAYFINVKINRLEKIIERISRMISDEEKFEINLHVYNRDDAEETEYAPEGITRADLIPVLKTTQDRYATGLNQLYAELKEVILKLKE